MDFPITTILAIVVPGLIFSLCVMVVLKKRSDSTTRIADELSSISTYLRKLLEK